MNVPKLSKTVFHLVAVSLLSLGFVQPSGAAVVSARDQLDAEQRVEQAARIQAILARQDVAAALRSLGVAADDVAKRVDQLTPAELADLEQSIDRHIAGGDAVSLVGAVFIVLLILELVGVTDIFKSI